MPFFYFYPHFMLDRTIQPLRQVLESAILPKASISQLANGVPLYYLNLGQQPVIKLELIFEAGTWQDNQAGVSFFTNKMLGEGTNNQTAKQIASYLDQLGAFIEYGHGMDRAGLTVHCLSKHLPQVLDLLLEMLTEASFPEKDLQNQQKQAAQNLSINQEKTAYLANRIFKEKIFGKNHPYSMSLLETHISAIGQGDLKDFYQNNYKFKPFKIFLSGSVSQQDIKLIDQILGQHTLQTPPQTKQVVATIQEPETSIVAKENSVQTSIRMGKQLAINRKHKDYTKLLLTNEVLGGYFGSRLMKNIREEKGLTYGISSSVPQMSKGSYFVIGTDVKAEFAELTISEIRKELISLQTIPVPAEELDRAKSYLIGQYVGSINTPFEVMERNKIIMLEGLDLPFYDNYPTRVRAVSQEDIMATAQKYLAEDSLTSVLVG
jgi:zinc protease